MAIKYVQTNSLYLAGAGVIIGAVNITLTSLTDIYGNVLTMSDFGTEGYITLEPDTTNEEAATFTSITSNANGTFTLGGVSTLLAKSPYTETSALIRAHAGGTKVVVTDNVGFWATFANKNNNETIIGAWTVPSPVNSGEIANKAYVLSVVTGGTVTTNAIIVTATAGSTITKGQIVYLDPTSSQWKIATSATASTIDNISLGIAQGAGTSGNPITGGVLTKGLDTTSFTGLTPSSVYFASTAGTISTSAGATKLTLGVAVSTSSLFFDPRYTTTVTENEKAALTGNSGIPSITNRFVTESGLSSSFKFGDSSDGSVTLDGVNTYAFLSLAGSSYTLTRDIYLNNLALNSGITLVTNGYLLFVNGTFSGSGTLDFGTPNPGGGGTGTTGGTAGATVGSGRIKSLAGKAGANNSGGNGAAGTNGTNTTATPGVAGSAGGGGGFGTGGSNVGGGASTGGTASVSTKVAVFSDLTLQGLDNSGAVFAVFTGSAGSGSGGSGAAGGGTGGGGGGSGSSGGGVLAFINNWSGTFLIKSIGGAGGAGSSGGGSGGGGGGGGGGAGGWSLIVYGIKSWTGTYNLVGGTGGAGGTSGTAGTGGSGTTGTTGTSYEVQVANLTR